MPTEGAEHPPKNKRNPAIPGGVDAPDGARRDAPANLADAEAAINDPRLALIIDAWPALPEAVKVEIVRLATPHVRAGRTGSRSGD